MSASLDRNFAPAFENLEKIKILRGQSVKLNSGTDLHILSAGTSDVLKFDIYFNAGSRLQNKNAIASAVNSLLTEGTTTKTAQQISESLDFLGAYLEKKCTPDESVISLFCLKKHFAVCLPIIHDIINNSVFPETELMIYKKNAIQRLVINKKRNSFIARRTFNSAIFGSDNPYGTFSEINDYKNISRENLLNFYSVNYVNKIKYLMVSGAVNDVEINLIQNVFNTENYSLNFCPIPTESLAPQKTFIEKSGSLQTTIRIGKVLFNRTHIDYLPMLILNLILGGYFGSRLMKKIREERGLTYGIYSTIESFFDGGCFYTETEVNNEYVGEVLKEVYAEINKLRVGQTDKEELTLCKNYLLGSFMRSIDGPFALAERYKILIDYNLDYSYYNNFIETINSITTEQLQNIAIKYLDINSLSEIIVGES